MDFSSRLPDMLALLKRLVETESPSHDKAAVDAVGKIVSEEARKAGALIEVSPQTNAGNHIIARWGKGSGGILTLCHMDTVFPLGVLKKMPFCAKEDRTYGPGVLDMKSGIVIVLTVLSALQASGKLPARPVTALFTSDEEIGSGTSRALIEELARESALALVFESGLLDGSLKTWRKGVGEFKIKVTGRAAHSGGEHEKGRNAIEELAHQVLVIQKLTDYQLGTTVNVGVMRGGTASNVVPDFAEANGDIRVLEPSEASRILSTLKALKPVLSDTSLEISGGLNRPPMPFDTQMQATFARAQEIAGTIEQTLKAGGSGGGSDANFIAQLGIPVLDGLGATGADYHSEREFILTNSLAERASLAAALIENW